MKQILAGSVDYTPFRPLVSLNGSVTLTPLGRAHGCLEALQEAASMDAQGQQ